jgi:hypothetical protein
MRRRSGRRKGLPESRVRQLARRDKMGSAGCWLLGSVMAREGRLSWVCEVKPFSLALRF